MKITVRSDHKDHFLVFEGALTHPDSRQTERRILDSIRIYKHLKVDLSGVREIDLSGTHLLGVLLSYSAEAIEIVATSPVVEVAMAPLLALRDAAIRAQVKNDNLHSRAG